MALSIKPKYLVGLLLLLLFIESAQAQYQLWGASQYGGPSNAGLIFKTAADGTGYTVQHDFTLETDGFGANDLTDGGNGKLYGTTAGGGYNHVGIIFEYTIASGALVKKYEFSGKPDGRTPVGKLVLASNQKLYGMTRYGGVNDEGTLFEFDPATNTYTKKYDFSNTGSGGNPQGSLIQAVDGYLYGMTSSSPGSDGTIIKFDIASGTLTKLYDFASNSGKNPVGSLMQASDGNLYGTTTQGGDNDFGTLFQFNPTSLLFTKRFDFSMTAGAFPGQALIELSTGKLYGTTQGFGAYFQGTLFEFNFINNLYTVKVDFASTTTGSNPKGSLTLFNGKLYGGTSVQPGGALIEFNPVDNSCTKKIVFDPVTMGSDVASRTLLVASDGKMYGTATNGGAGDGGTLFEYNPATNSFNKLLEFSKAPGGSYPLSGLMQASTKKLYGMAQHGGTNAAGILYEIDPKLNTFSKRVDFTLVNGYQPWGNELIETAAGELYGMVWRGGAVYNFGVIFRFDPGTGNMKTYALDETTGFGSTGKLVEAANGKLYGMGSSTNGGTSTGAIFEFDPVSETTTKKIEFTTLSGQNDPGGLTGSLMRAANNKLYGMSSAGGDSNNGALFEYDPSTNNYIKLFDFPAGSATPYGSLVQYGNGKLYGLTFNGGINNGGTLFEFDLSNNSHVIRFSFDAASGTKPVRDLIIAPNGKLYGLTTAGGLNNHGTIFEFDPLSGAFTKTHDFINEDCDYVSLALVSLGEDQTISFGAPGAKTFGDPAFSPGATSSSGLAVTYTSSDPLVATVSGNQVTITGAGSTLITASQPGDSNYNPAPSVSQTLIVNKKNQSIQFDLLVAKTVGDASFTLSATTSSGLPVTYTSSDPSVATVSGNQVTITGFGSTLITASQTGNANYNAAPAASQLLFVFKKSQSIQFDPLTAKTVGDASFTLSATASSGLVVTYTSSDPSVATVSGNTITIIGAGSTLITAAQSGNSNYSPAPAASQTLLVNKKSQSIQFGPLAAKALGDASFTLSATASSGLTVTYTSSNLSVATVSGNQVTLTGIGSTVIAATQTGNPEYLPALKVEQILQVNPVITAIENAPGIKLYPIPVDNFLHVDVQSPSTITIMNLLGEEIAKREVTGAESFDLRQVPGGFYVVSIARDGEVFLKKIVKKE
ncbi:hypothetical protein WSM22_35670 [Cytophagales bacterium WSM2-2]|nr:hypothetical protein WSM22_35670 [Cytophagales bacterium WSM2-2]